VGYVLERRALFLFLFFLKKEKGDFRLFAFFFSKKEDFTIDLLISIRFLLL